MDYLTKAHIDDVNARYYGIDLKKTYSQAGSKIAEALINDFGQNKDYAFICGLGGNAGDGFTAAISLLNKSVKSVVVYLVGRPQYIEHPVAKELFEELYALQKSGKFKNLKIQLDCYSSDIKPSEVVVEALVGTGFKGERLNKRFRDVINRITHFKSKIAAIDLPAFSYNPDKVYSLNYPKKEGAEIIEISELKEVNNICGPGDVKYIFTPKYKTHKAKNGKILVISSTENLESIINFIDIANQYAAYTYIYNFNQDNSEIVQKSKDYEFVADDAIEEAIKSVDCIFYYNFDFESLLNKSVLSSLVEVSDIKQIFSSNSLRFFNLDDLKHLTNKLIFITNNIKGTSFRSLAQTDKFVSVVYGFQTSVFNIDGEYKVHASALTFNNQYRDIFEPLTAIFSTKNDLDLSADSALFLIDTITKQKKIKDMKEVIEYLPEFIEACKEF